MPQNQRRIHSVSIPYSMPYAQRSSYHSFHRVTFPYPISPLSSLSRLSLFPTLLFSLSHSPFFSPTLLFSLPLSFSLSERSLHSLSHTFHLFLTTMYSTKTKGTRILSLSFFLLLPCYSTGSECQVEEVEEV